MVGGGMGGVVRVYVVCSAAFGAQKRRQQLEVVCSTGGGGVETSSFLSWTAREVVCTCVRVRVYNTIKWRFLLNGRELSGRTGGGGCCGRNRGGGAEGNAMTRWTGRRRTTVTGWRGERRVYLLYEGHTAPVVSLNIAAHTHIKLYTSNVVKLQPAGVCLCVCARMWIPHPSIVHYICIYTWRTHSPWPGNLFHTYTVQSIVVSTSSHSAAAAATFSWTTPAELRATVAVVASLATIYIYIFTAAVVRNVNYIYCRGAVCVCVGWMMLKAMVVGGGFKVKLSPGPNKRSQGVRHLGVLRYPSGRPMPTTDAVLPPPTPRIMVSKSKSNDRRRANPLPMSPGIPSRPR